MLEVWSYEDPTLVTQPQSIPREIADRLAGHPTVQSMEDLLGTSAEASRAAQAVEPGDETPDAIMKDEPANATAQSFIMAPRSITTEKLHESPAADLTHDLDIALPVFTLDPEISQDGTRISTQENSDSQSSNQQRSYLLNTKLSDGRSALLLDIGSVGNLMSQGWARVQAILAAGQGYMAKYKVRKTPLRISGVGHGHQSCDKDGRVPVCLADTGNTKHVGIFEAPMIEGDMPALMGRLALQRERTLIDIVTNKVYMMGPGDYSEALESAMPPGTRCFQAEIAQSGHMMLPCAAYDSGTIYKGEQGLKLHSELKLPVSEFEEFTQATSSRQTPTTQAKQGTNLASGKLKQEVVLRPAEPPGKKASEAKLTVPVLWHLWATRAALLKVAYCCSLGWPQHLLQLLLVTSVCSAFWSCSES